MGSCKNYGKFYVAIQNECFKYVHRFFICIGWAEVKGRLLVPLHIVFEQVYHLDIAFEDIWEITDYPSCYEKKYQLERKGKININSVDVSFYFKSISLLMKDELISYTKSVAQSRNNVCHIEKERFHKGLTEEALYTKINELEKNIKENGCIKEILKNCGNICGKYYR